MLVCLDSTFCKEMYDENVHEQVVVKFVSQNRKKIVLAETVDSPCY